ncbi:hypothetical protein, partial [uncultured Desulfovibrio sp.]|uniref:hypothetical protein n=1 Tax=uncultured Desulfovibrio sp. TaxID=167968 RepID=UPI002608FA59
PSALLAHVAFEKDNLRGGATMPPDPNQAENRVFSPETPGGRRESAPAGKGLFFAVALCLCPRLTIRKSKG